MLNQETTKTDIQHDLRDARALLEQAGRVEEKRKYRKAAEIILLKALRLDPENEEAKILLQSVRAMPVLTVPGPPSEPVLKETPKPQEDPKHPEPALFANLAKPQKKKSRSKIVFGVVLLLALGGGVLWIQQTHGMSSRQTYTPAPAKQPAEHSNAPATLTDSAPAAPGQDLSAAPSAPSAQNAAVTAPAVAPAVPAMGRLAVSSLITAEIYQGNKHLGSTPATLQLPRGRQTLEYRHGDLRTVIAHDIKPDETTTASVTFQRSVQVNARPWAQVFLDGSPRRSLGQTPLSAISVPIGGVLVFENPNFTSKTHRITETDTAIQVDFP